MTDIVERLRKFCKWPEPGDGIPDDPVFANVPDLEEAADEIERYREALQKIAGLTMSMCLSVGDLAQRQKDIAFEALGVRHD